MANGFYIELSDILDDYTKEVTRAANNSIDVVAKQAVEKLKSTSPKQPKGGEYAAGWRIKRIKGTGGRGRINSIYVYNKTHPGLTHLLELGHDVYNGLGGPFGKAPPIKHIKPVEEWANTELPAEIERELK